MVLSLPPFCFCCLLLRCLLSLKFPLLNSQETAPALEDCLNLLRGETDEQRLGGLLLATKFRQGDDKASILQVYNAVGAQFLNRLLKTGMVKGTGGGKGIEDREAYLRLSVTIIAAFCRVQEIASSEDMISKVPVMLEIISKTPDPLISEECYEILLSLSMTTEDGFTRLYESGIMTVLASHISTLADGSRSMELALKIIQLILTKLPADVLNIKHQSEMSSLVVAVARQFGVLHTALKFDALHLLTTILSSDSAGLLHDLKSRSNAIWASYVRVGIVAVLQNRVVSAEKLQALSLAESMMSIMGEDWLLDKNDVADAQDPIPVDKRLLLVLESSRIEVSVLLNELACLKYEASKSSSTAESVTRKQRNLAVSFSLIENIIKLISGVSETEGNSISESTITKAITGLNETFGLVLDFLCDAKDHGQRKGDDLLASVRLLGSYLAETPFACKEKVQNLLEYILSVEGEDEPSPFYSICFMLPMLCQTTMEFEGCKTLLSFGGHKAVVDCLVKVVGPAGHAVEDSGTAFLACDTILNLLLNGEKIRVKLDESCLASLLQALALWTEKNDAPSIVMIVSSICALVFSFTSEEALLETAEFDQNTLQRLSQIIARSWDASEQVEGSSDIRENRDLHRIVTTGYSHWSNRFPQVRKAVERCLQGCTS